MTADIRAAAQDESWKRWDGAWAHAAMRQCFIEGAVWGAARVTPTKGQLVEVAEKVIGEFPARDLDPNKSWAQQEAEEVADAVLALMQELAEGGSGE